MTKYKFDEKRKVVEQYFNHHQSMNEINKQTNIPRSIISDWIHKYDLHGLEGIKNKANTRKFSPDEKYQILKFMAEHKLSMKACAQYFNIRSSQIYQWQKKFNEHGILGLENNARGRPNMSKKIKSKQQPKKSDITELERLKEENLKLKNTLAKTEMELDITKKWVALTKPELTKESWWKP
jgi:transposase